VTRLEISGDSSPGRRSAVERVERAADEGGALELGDLGACLTQLGIGRRPLRVWDLARRIIRLDLVIDERIEEVFLAEVLEEILLAPPCKHPVGDLDGGKVAARCQHRRLVIALTTRDLAQLQAADADP
jgi:hypothetical protein